MPRKAKPPTVLTLAAFARSHGFAPVTVWRTVKDDPGLAKQVANASAPGGFMFVVMDTDRLAAAVRARLERNGYRRPDRYPTRPPPAPAGSSPAAGGSDGDD